MSNKDNTSLALSLLNNSINFKLFILAIKYLKSSKSDCIGNKFGVREDGSTYGIHLINVIRQPY